jgi:hypothetical protein
MNFDGAGQVCRLDLRGNASSATGGTAAEDGRVHRRRWSRPSQWTYKRLLVEWLHLDLTGEGMPGDTSNGGGSNQRELLFGELAASSIIESCHSIWLFDELNRRFRRVVKGLDLDAPVTTDWRPYDHVRIEEHSDAFLVFLDPSGTRLLRSWRHVAPGCDRCQEETTAELSLEEIASFAGSLESA